MLSDLPFEVPKYLLDLAKDLPRQRMAVAGADHPTVLESARQAAAGDLIDPVLIGDVDAIKAMAEEIGWDISGFETINAAGEKAAPDAAVALARGNEVSSVMKGHVHTDSLMAAVVRRDGGLRVGRRLSHIFHMTVPESERVLMITDGAVNVAPDEATQMDIINNAVGLAHALGNDQPHVALLSGTESPIPAMPSSMVAARIAARAANGEVHGAVVDGPFAFDNAVSPDAAALKGVDSPVAGNADILVAPNIETGNGLFKMMVYFMSATAAGVVMGAKVPIVLTSRADPPEARFAATAIAAVAAGAAQDG